MSKHIEKYADLLVRVGINIKKGQTLVINSPLECADFARKVTVKAYEAGAREVIMHWIDEQSDKIRYERGDDALFDEFPQWRVDFLTAMADRDAAFLSIAASDPELMKDVDSKRIARQRKAMSQAVSYYRSRMMSHKNVWCVASVPTQAWADKVFPQAGDQAQEKLWEAIFKAVRADQDDPVALWQELQRNFERRMKILQGHAFTALRFKNARGTDVTVELPQNHLWMGGGVPHEGGHISFPNIPTEEIFTAPHKNGANGTVVSAMPLNYNGNLIEDFRFTLKDGLIVDFDAKKGKEVLAELLDTDEGARRLGEVALVPYDSPISNQNILFYNTLFDENASCHFALGKAYPTCLAGHENMDQAALEAAGLNESLTHVDFMIGTEDLEITGIGADGTETPVFTKGNFSF